jgi:hypothetical protein
MSAGIFARVIAPQEFALGLSQLGDRWFESISLHRCVQRTPTKRVLEQIRERFVQRLGWPCVTLAGRRFSAVLRDTANATG